MRLTFRAKLLVAMLLLVGVVVAIVAFQLDRTLARDLRAQVAERLERQALGGATWLSQNRHPERLASRVADLVGADVTIYDLEGQVIATSPGAPNEAEPGPEVRDALAHGVGRSTRADAQGNSFAHVAVRAAGSLLRLSAPLSSVDATVADMRLHLLIASLIGVLAAALLGVVASGLASQPLRKMTEAARHITGGDYDVTLPAQTPDDFGRLSEALGVLASQLKTDMTRIEQLERVRRDFVANVSHELRTPVTAIKGYTETLLDGVDEASRRDFLEALRRHADRIEALVSDLLRLAKLEAHATDDLVREPVDVAAIARHVVAAAHARDDRDCLRLEVEMDEPLMATGDPLAVEQVLDNLVDNAIKYAGEGKRVRIAGAARDGAVELTVSDDGPGIAEEHRARIFERFYRLPNAARHEGTGLGLAITKHLVLAMDGSIRVEENPDGGTRFVVRLPEHA